MRTLALVSLFALVGCGTSPGLSSAPTATAESSLTTIWGSRRTIVYAPADSAGLPLVVALHGCTQTADEFLAATRLLELAERERFVVLAVEQSLLANPSRCWNWFLPINQSGFTGEPAIIIEAIRRTRRDLQLGDDTYVLGLSAGGAMAGILSVCRPDVIDAAALASAPKVPVVEACGGITERRAMIFQGTIDSIVPALNGDAWWQHYYWMADHADDWFFDESVATTVTQRRVNQRDVTITSSDALEYWSIDGMAHAWSGGDPSYDYADALGPDATTLAWDFFNK